MDGLLKTRVSTRTFQAEVVYIRSQPQLNFNPNKLLTQFVDAHTKNNKAALGRGGFFLCSEKKGMMVDLPREYDRMYLWRHSSGACFMGS